jgi:hypothetical protein
MTTTTTRVIIDRARGKRSATTVEAEDRSVIITSPALQTITHRRTPGTD